MIKIGEEKKKIIAKISMMDIVSFDIFDTLVLRNVLEPVDIFKIVDYEYNSLYEEELGFDFCIFRQEVEKYVRDKFKFKEEISFDDIYNEITVRLGLEISDRLKDLELKLEKKFIVENSFMKEIYNYCILNNKRVYIISDMYLSNDTLTEILDNLGYRNYRKLYVSSEIERTKATGNLYSYIREEENISLEEKWLHIGDNYISDVKNPLLENIESYHYVKISDRYRYNKDNYVTISASIQKALELNSIGTNSFSYWEEFGIKYATPLYYGISVWLYKEILKTKTKKIFFLSRDGYILNKIYNNFYKNMVEYEYLYTSRRAFQYAVLADKRFEDIFEVLIEYNASLGQKLTLKECLLNLEFDIEKIKEKILFKDGDTLEMVISYKNKNRVKVYLKCLEKEIRDKLEVEKRNLLSYLQQKRIFELDEINIFDIGWRGSIQKTLKLFLRKEVNGFYLGTTSFLHQEIRNSSKGFIFNKGYPYIECEKVLKFIMVYEMLFSAPEGSLINFVEKQGKVYPNLKKVEGNKEILEAIEEIQNTALKHMEDYRLYSEYLQINSYDAIRNLNEMLDLRQYKDLNAFSKLSNTVGFGNSEDKKQYVLVSTLDEYIKNREKIKSNISLWPNALLIKDTNGRIFTEEEVNKIYFDISHESVQYKVPLFSLVRVKKGIKHLKEYGIVSFLKKSYQVIKYNITN